jgi:hypothetical protein
MNRDVRESGFVAPHGGRRAKMGRASVDSISTQPPQLLPATISRLGACQKLVAQEAFTKGLLILGVL